MSVKFDLGSAEQAAGVIDQPDRFQRRAEFLQPLPDPQVPQQLYRTGKEGGGPPVTIEPSGPMGSGSKRNGNICRRESKGGSKARGAAANDDH
jgi:hypothetical protein